MFWDFLYVLGVTGAIFSATGIFYILYKCFLFLVYHFLDDGKMGFFDYLKRS